LITTTEGHSLRVWLLFAFVMLFGLLTATAFADDLPSSAEKPTTTTTTTSDAIGQTTTVTTYRVLTGIHSGADQSDLSEDTHITIFKDGSQTAADHQDLFVEISSEYCVGSKVYSNGESKKIFVPLADDQSFANPVKEGTIDFSVDESVDIDYSGIKTFVNDGDIHYNDKLKYPVYQYGTYREIPNIYNIDSKKDVNGPTNNDIANFLPTGVETVTEALSSTAIIHIPIVGPLLSALSMASDTREALNHLGAFPHITIGDNIDESEAMTKKYSNILNERDIVEVPWNPEAELVFFSKAYESVVIKVPIRIKDPAKRRHITVKEIPDIQLQHSLQILR